MLCENLILYRKTWCKQIVGAHYSDDSWQISFTELKETDEKKNNSPAHPLPPIDCL